MSEFRFSPRPNRAGDIHWRPWGEAAFAEAAATGRPVLLNLTAVWCQWCQLMDETTLSDPGVIAVINAELIPVRVDADRAPHVQDRYIAGGWPTNAFLTPTGEVLWAGTYIDAAEFRRVAASVLVAWRTRRGELELEIERRRRALEAARGRPHSIGLVRREAADDVLAAARASFDARNGGFGDAPKFPQPELIELLYSQAFEDPTLAAMADQTLDGMLAGELWDAVDGGFFRYALAADWTSPRYEKLLDANAGLLEAYALAGWLRGRDDWSAIAERTVAWVETTLGRPDGLWGGSQAADVTYCGATATQRQALPRPPVDRTAYASANGHWISSLATAGARLREPRWVQRAELALQALLGSLRAPGGGVYRYRDESGAPHVDFLLTDTLQVGRAALALAQATGNGVWVDEARRLARHMEDRLWADDGAFWDRCRSPDDVGALRYRDRPFEANAEAARFLLDLAAVTGERGWRAHAERTLTRLAPLAGRHGVAGASCALAIHEFFEAPPRVFVALPHSGGDDGAVLRAAAFALRLPGLRVWTVPSGHTVGPQRFVAQDVAAAYVWTRRGCTGPIALAERLVDAL
jgi:uncharacterized protein YyaL (SSP411 family)